MERFVQHKNKHSNGKEDLSNLTKDEKMEHFNKKLRNVQSKSNINSSTPEAVKKPKVTPLY